VQIHLLAGDTVVVNISYSGQIGARLARHEDMHGTSPFAWVNGSNSQNGRIQHTYTVASNQAGVYVFQIRNNSFTAVAALTGQYRHATPVITRNARIRFDATFYEGNPSFSSRQSIAMTHYYRATDSIRTTFGINLLLNTNDVFQADELDGRRCRTNRSEPCINSNTNGCGTVCGQHHKNVDRLLLIFPQSSPTFNVMMVGHVFCEGPNHTSQVGKATAPYIPQVASRRDSISSTFIPNFDALIQHELGHNIGVGHCNTVTPNEDCVMKSVDSSHHTWNTWCSSCSNSIRFRRRFL
jgi:hypothetical protein